eukprot:SAG31_NODE_1110_length_9858_cov_41.473922_2_plen_99_part_00
MTADRMLLLTMLLMVHLFTVPTRLVAADLTDDSLVSVDGWHQASLPTVELRPGPAGYSIVVAGRAWYESTTAPRLCVAGATSALVKVRGYFSRFCAHY